MTREIISEALGFVDMDYILEAMQPVKAGGRRANRLVRTLLAAAAAALLLAATALAAYHYRLRDAVMEVPSYSFGTDSITNLEGLSVNGFRDAPEYQAFAEWWAWLQQDSMERPQRFAELGVDDSYYETPKNYAHLYNAPFADQAAALDEIAERYGLYLHECRESYDTEGQLCTILGLEDLLDERYGAAAGYIYEDGSFRADGWLKDSGYTAWTLMVSAKGSFMQAFSVMLVDWEEWSFVTPAGRELLLAKDEDNAQVLAELEGAYVNLGLKGDWSREEIEALALGLDWEALEQRFDGRTSREEAAAALEAWLQAGRPPVEEEDLDKAAEEFQAAQEAAEAAERRLAEEAAELAGRYDFASLPEGIGFGYEIGQTGSVWDWLTGENIGTETILRRLYYGDRGESLMLASHWCENDGGLCPRAVFEARRKWAEHQFREGMDDVEAFGEIEVGGHEAYYTILSSDSFEIPEGETEPVETVHRQAIVVWLDEEAERLFGLNYSCDGEPGLSIDELVALAGGVQPVE